MRPLIGDRRKTIELIVLLVLDLILYGIFSDLDLVTMFTLGFIWNWTASQDLSVIFEKKRRYRLSTLKAVVNLQQLILRPFVRAPLPVQLFFKVLPAGIFWYGVLYLNESQMPWWGVFLGSLMLELLELERLLRTPSEQVP